MGKHVEKTRRLDDFSRGNREMFRGRHRSRNLTLAFRSEFKVRSAERMG